MRSLTVPLVIVLAVVPLAGCLGGSSGQPTGDTLPDNASGDPVPANSSAALDDPQAGSNDTRIEAVEVDWTGSLTAGVCVPSPLGGCTGADAPGSDRRRVPGLPGDPVTVNLTLTWQASAPTTEELSLTVSAVHETSCGDSCTAWYHNHTQSVQGTSPLSLEVDGFEVQSHEEFTITVADTGDLPVGYGYARLDQSFEVTGTVDARVEG